MCNRCVKMNDPMNNDNRLNGKYMVIAVVILLLLLVIGNIYQRYLQLNSDNLTFCGVVVDVFDKKIDDTKATPLRHVILNNAENVQRTFIIKDDIGDFILSKNYKEQQNVVDRLKRGHSICITYSTEYTIGRSSYVKDFPAVLKVYEE